MTATTDTARVAHDLQHWLLVLSGDGVTDTDLFVAAVGQRRALRKLPRDEREAFIRELFAEYAAEHV